MPHRITWLDEPWLMQVDYYGDVTGADLEAVMEFSLPAADQHTINFLINFSELEKFEASAWRETALMQLMRHPNVKWFAMVGINPMLRFVLQIVTRFTSFKSFENKADAIAFLEEMVAFQKEQAEQSAQR